MKPNTRNKWLLATILALIVAVILIAVPASAAYNRSLSDGLPPLKKQALWGPKKHPTHIVPNVWGWVDPLGLKCENSAGTATVHWHDNRGPGNAFGHYSVETSSGGKTIHTHQLGAPGTDTMISTDLSGVVSPTKSHTFDLPNAKAAQEFQLQNLNKIGPPYDTKTRSCVTHVGEVLRAGGLEVPTNPGGQFKYLKKAGL